MSLAKPTLLTNMGDIKGVIYDFEKAGDILAKHTHTEETAHIMIVAKGSIKAYSHDWEVVIPAGKVADFPANQPHEFMALEDNTRIVTIIKKFGGFVNDYTEPPVEKPELIVEDIEPPEVHTVYL